MLAEAGMLPLVVGTHCPTPSKILTGPKNDFHMAKSRLTIPAGAGRTIVESGALFACPLLCTNNFVKFCSDCGLAIYHKERLIRLEHLGLFAPVFRVKMPETPTEPFRIPPTKGENWFSKGWAWDTTAIPSRHVVPEDSDLTHEGYYSIFQIYHLDFVLSRLTLQLSLEDPFLEESSHWQEMGTRWVNRTQHRVATMRNRPHPRPAVALLCQHISNRYYPYTQSDMRQYEVRKSSLFDAWISINDHAWDWKEEMRNWDPRTIENLYGLTQKNLCEAYSNLAIDQASCDPIEHWYQLTQFIAIDERRKLKGAALQAETLRAGALMLRELHKDLYGEELPHPNEVARTVIQAMPEMEVRNDVRRHLEFVANRFHVNPQPRLSLIVEGQTEESAIIQIFEQYFGIHPGVLGIEIIVLGGVNVATGSKKEDRFRAIMLLIDYLHHHQTVTFLLLDNENRASKLKEAAKEMKSIYTDCRYLAHPEHVFIWEDSFELDNFSYAEIATSLGEVAEDRVQFTAEQVAEQVEDAKRQCTGAALGILFKRKTNYALPKIKLSESLVSHMFSETSSRKIEDRPIIQILKKVEYLAVNNRLSFTQKAKDTNQESTFFGLKPSPQAKTGKQSTS
ncbi:MAG: hypothetical protein ERJ67_11210 [Aphanocapsa feldmannii 277cV]|uniref:Uncharacterized protein n=1 Tax=Aphanocapsa feldmannii 277cV TaxID=2507553 RepID=A0A524RKM2_9CHRO|nr:MAG: hypothetical protein ERJ67_11210 [Aphanocapsa feldmannii 277cV]